MWIAISVNQPAGSFPEECFSIEDFDNCTGGNNSYWYLKAKCYNEDTVYNFLDMLDECIRTFSVTESCKIKVDLDFPENKNYSVEDMIGCSWSGKNLLQVYHPCFNRFQLYHGHQEFKGNTIGKYRLDTTDSETSWNLRNLNRPLSEMLLSYCQNLHKDESKLQCLRQIVRPLERFSSEEYFEANFDHPDASAFDMKGFNPYSILAHLLTAALITAALWKGVRTMGKVVYLTATLPIFMIVILIIFAATLEGHKTGIEFYLRTNFCKLKSPELWMTVIGHVFFSVGIGGGGLTTLASYNKFENDLLRDALIVGLANDIFSFVGGFAIFGIMGFMANKVNMQMEDILRGGSSNLAYGTMAQATVAMPGSKFWSVFFYALLGLLAVDSSLAMLHTIHAWLFDEYAICRKWQKTTAVSVGIIVFLLGLPEVSRYGSSIVNLVDSASFIFFVPLCTIGELALVSYLYGLRRFMNDIGMMFALSQSRRHLSKKVWNSCLDWYWIITWLFTAPVGIFTMFLLTITIDVFIADQNIQHVYNKDWLTALIYWSIAVGFLPLSLVACLIWNYLYRGITPGDLFLPTEHWGPARNAHRLHGYFEPLSVRSEDKPLNTERDFLEKLKRLSSEEDLEFDGTQRSSEQSGDQQSSVPITSESST